MFKAIKDDKIIAVNDENKFPLIVFDRVEEDTEHTTNDYGLSNNYSEFIPKQEVKKAEIRAVRDNMINSMSWRVERANEQERLGIACEDNSITLLIYKQYLRDYPESSEDWYERKPLSYEEWVVENKKKKN